MSLASAPLPTDPDALRMFAADLQAELARKDIEIAANAAEIHAKTLHIEKLKMQLAVLRRARFGRSSEKLDHEIEQLELLIGELEEEQAEGDARANAADPAQPHPAQTHGPSSRRSGRGEGYGLVSNRYLQVIAGPVRRIVSRDGYKRRGDILVAHLRRRRFADRQAHAQP
jgi:hypothetical protein